MANTFIAVQSPGRILIQRRVIQSLPDIQQHQTVDRDSSSSSAAKSRGAARATAHLHPKMRSLEPKAAKTTMYTKLEINMTTYSFHDTEKKH